MYIQYNTYILDPRQEVSSIFFFFTNLHRPKALFHSLSLSVSHDDDDDDLLQSFFHTTYPYVYTYTVHTIYLFYIYIPMICNTFFFARAPGKHQPYKTHQATSLAFPTIPSSRISLQSMNYWGRGGKGLTETRPKNPFPQKYLKIPLPTQGVPKAASAAVFHHSVQKSNWGPEEWKGSDTHLSIYLLRGCNDFFPLFNCWCFLACLYSCFSNLNSFYHTIWSNRTKMCELTSQNTILEFGRNPAQTERD